MKTHYLAHRVPKVEPSNRRIERRMALPSSRLMRVSTSDKVGFLGTSASTGSLSRLANVELSFALLTLLSLYPPPPISTSSPFEPDSMIDLFHRRCIVAKVK